MKGIRKAAWIVICCLLAGSAFSLPAGKAAASDEYDEMREKWKVMITGGDAYDESDPDIAARIAEIEAKAQARWDALNTSADRTRLWNDLGSSSNDVKEAFRRLRDMALGYTVKGSALKNNVQLRDDLISAMEWMYVHRYNESTPNTYNWWDWEIGSPLAINDIVVLMYDEFPPALRTNLMNAVHRFSPKVEMSGANRVWKATVVLLSGIIMKDSGKLQDARDGLSQLFVYSNSGDGFYSDGSFIQHSSFPYTGGYGKNLLYDIANVMYLLEGSSWTVVDPNRTRVLEWVYNSFEPLMYKGAMMDMVRGREISRNLYQDHVVGHLVMQALIRVSQFAPAADALRIKSMVKHWIMEDTYRSFYDDADINMIVLAKQIMNDDSIAPRGELVLHKQFPRMDRAVHHRPGFAFGISMHSTRISNYESINSENKRAWHTADGMTYLYNADLSQFSDDFWPTVDPYRLPGTTVLKETTAASGRGGSNAVGGAALEQYGIVAMHLMPAGQTLDAKKSWFLFDDEVVALGGDISASEGKAVETVIENRKLNAAGTNAFTVNGTAKPALLGWSEALHGVNWAHLEGNVAGAGIGYYFPDSAALEAVREARTGKWSDLNTYDSVFGDPTPITRNYLKMWIDHGADPVSASYAYVILPNRSASEVSDYASQPDIIVLENSGDAQAVKETTLGVTAIQFWKNQSKTVGGVTSDNIASVVVKETPDLIMVSAADPTQANTGTINIQLDQSAVCTVEKDAAITVQQLSPSIRFSVDTNNAKGKSHLITFKKEGSCGDDPKIYIFEAEDLPMTSSGDTYAVYTTDSQASGGKWRIYNSDEIGDYIEHTLHIPQGGTYIVSVRGKHYHDRAIAQLSVEGADLGAPIDFYHPSAMFKTTQAGTVSFASGGAKTFRFTVIGKHASSSNYKIPLDAIQLERIGPPPSEALFEAEHLSINVSSGDNALIHNHGAATNGKFVKLAADAANDFISFTVNIAEPGSYRVEVRNKKYSDRGQYRLLIDGVQQGGIQDQYASSEVYDVSDLGLVHFLHPGHKVFTFEVTGTSGSGYNLAFDHIRLVPQ